MENKSSNKSLRKADGVKNDEFYIRFDDIQAELNFYKDQLKDKVIYCNCDDPFESNFFKYFAANLKNYSKKANITAITIHYGQKTTYTKN